MTSYNTIDKRLHLLCQPIAKAGRSFLKSVEDDSHTNLFFDPLSSSIKGRWINHDDQKYLLGFDLLQNQYFVLDQSMTSIKKFSTIGKTISELENELNKFFISIGLTKGDYLANLHFEIPEYPLAKDPIAELNQQSLEYWEHFRTLANETLATMLGYFQDPGEVRIWPHHFDTGIYVQLSEIGIGLGLAMKDEIGNSPYFYVAGYPSHDELNFSETTDLEQGFWSTSSSWKGAVYPLKDLANAKQMDQKRLVQEFFLAAISWFLKKPI